MEKKTSLAIADESCCGPTCCGGSTREHEPNGVHEGLANVLQKYNVNDYAASVKVYAIKPR